MKIDAKNSVNSITIEIGGHEFLFMGEHEDFEPEQLMQAFSDAAHEFIKDCKDNFDCPI